MGGFWSALAGAPTKDVEDNEFWDIYAQQKEKFLKDPAAYLNEVGEAVGVVGEGLGDMLDELDRKVFEELEKLDRKYIDSLNIPDSGKSKPGDLMASAGRAAPGAQANDGAASPDKKTSETESPDIAKFREDLLKPDHPVDEIMLKRTEQLTEDEAKALTIRRIEMPPGLTRSDDMAEKEFAFIDHYLRQQPGRPHTAHPNTADGAPLAQRRRSHRRAAPRRWPGGRSRRRKPPGRCRARPAGRAQPARR